MWPTLFCHLKHVHHEAAASTEAVVLEARTHLGQGHAWVDAALHAQLVVATHQVAVSERDVGDDLTLSKRRRDARFECSVRALGHSQANLPRPRRQTTNGAREGG